MTTPEQLQAWRKEFESGYRMCSRYDNGMYDDAAIHCNWVGYLRAKQETEQAIKDARKQALEDAMKLCIKNDDVKDVMFAIKELIQ